MSTPALACGPWIEFPDFTPVVTPDVTTFVRGELGIIQPTYARRYLLAAWRVLNDRPLTSVEQRVYLPEPVQAVPMDAVQTWMNARTQIVPPISEYPRQQSILMTRNYDIYAYFTNCGDSAFLTAAQTLQVRHRALGPGPAIAEWIRAQDMVFANCGRQLGTAPSIPQPLAPEAPQLARADRAYQIAAARFYAGQFDEAEAEFAAIGRDMASPWRTLAPYLAARAIVRKGTMGGPKAEGDPASLARAEATIDAILRDPAQATVHEPVRRLRLFIVSRARPFEVLRDAARDLEAPVNEARFGERLADFEFILNRPDRFPDTTGQARQAAREASDLLDWVFALQAGGEDSLAHALSLWDQSHRIHWLVAALTLLPPDHPRVAELIERAAAISPTAPAYSTLAFGSARLLLRGGRVAEARAVLDRALAGRHLPVTSANLFKSARLMTARTLDEFLRDAERVAADAASGTRTRMLDRDSIDVFNQQMSVATLRRSASSPLLSARARRDLVLATFVRALLIDQLETARAMLPDVVQVEPSLRSATGRLDTPDNGALRDEAALLLLRTPGLRPYVPAWSFRGASWLDHEQGLTTLNYLRDNWWCAFSPGDSAKIARYDTPNLYRGSRVSVPQSVLHGDGEQVWTPAFLTREERQAAVDEWRHLERVDAGPNELGRRVLDWARRRPDDPRVPESLHRVVRATRLGCTTEATGAISREAFTLLHTRYPKSPWAARTPYWFK